jgi:hypothetical protein
MTDTDIRTFLTSTTRWMDERYERVWNELRSNQLRKTVQSYRFCSIAPSTV